MKQFRSMRGLGAVLLAVLSAGTLADAASRPKPVLTSVNSRIDPSYKRKQLPDGTFQREFYAISNGGMIDGTTRDNAQDQMNMEAFVQVLVAHLARQNYHFAPDEKSADLLLIVYWGRTIPFNDANYRDRVGQAGAAVSALQTLRNTPQNVPAPSSPEQAQQMQAGINAQLQAELAAADAAMDQLTMLQMENTMRDNSNLGNARLLGYVDAINDADDISRFAGGGQRYEELRGDIEESRYYVILAAYDFRRLHEKKERKVLWVTRISIRAQGNSFEQNVDDMIARAARYFGRNSGGLVREYEGKVEFGEAEVVGIVEEAPEPAAPAPAAESPPTAERSPARETQP